MHINELKHRLKNAFTAAMGATGISLLNLYRTSQEMEYVASSLKILKMSSLFGVIAGAVWFFMPKAVENTHEETVAVTKEFVKEPINVLINRTIEEQKEFVKDLKAKKYRTTTTGWVKPYTSTPYNSSTPSKSSTGATVNTPEVPDWKAYTASYQRGFEKAGRRSSTDDDEPPGLDDDYHFDEIEDSIFQDELDDYLSSLEDS